MTEKEKRDAGLPYLSEEKELTADRMRAKTLIFRYNALSPAETAEKQAILRELLGKTGDDFWVESPFYCDYGSNITIGEHFYANHNCVILDCAKVTIGDHVMFGPNVSLFGAGHPLDPDERAAGVEFSRPITIEDKVWIGGNACVLPGVTIGEGSVIGAGSVVTKDIPPFSVAVGNPCKVVRKIETK